MIRPLGALTAGLLALALAGCATTSGPGAAVPSRATAGTVQVGTAGTVRTTPPSEADRNPDRLRGLDPDAVAHLIGLPHYTRREGGATVWQYHAGACVMDLFWYPTTDGPRIVHYEVRGVRLAAVAEPRSCFGDLLVHRRDATTS